TGFTHSDLLCWQIDYAGGSLNVNGTIMRDTYIIVAFPEVMPCGNWLSGWEKVDLSGRRSSLTVIHVSA
ncbi:hypothetical protein, partial [Salmonella enterica]|uniref:hypothetical protein n=2 Tax=Salmonella enterica TaxID=28901 RepID=UPI0009AD8520